MQHKKGWFSLGGWKFVSREITKKCGPLLSTRFNLLDWKQFFIRCKRFCVSLTADVETKEK